MAPYIPFLAVHIAAGFTALAAGMAALLTEKGGRIHRQAGRIFFWAMVLVTSAAFIIAILRPNPFLFAIAIFSLYLVFAGRRAANLRPDTKRWPDWVAAIAMLVAALGMVGWGGQHIRHGEVGLAPVLIIFGLIGGALAVQDLHAIRLGPAEEKGARLARHVGRMVGGMIAATTAFVVVNGSMLPELLRWLGPTILFVPFIAYWTRRLVRA